MMKLNNKKIQFEKNKIKKHNKDDENKTDDKNL